jgi:RNA polymerase primary sigma factor
MTIEETPLESKILSVGPDRKATGSPAPRHGGSVRLSDRPRDLRVFRGAAKQGGSSLSDVAQAINVDRARRLLKQKLEYVYHPSFDEPDAAARFLTPLPEDRRELTVGAKRGAGLPAALSGLYGSATLLQPEEEVHLFLKMNYLKFHASKLRQALNGSCAWSTELAQIERLQSEALMVKNRIVRAFVRLAISLAKSRAGPDRSFSELLSDGNLALVRAAERFDVARGFKFSTYAHCAIKRMFSKMTFREVRWRCRFLTGHEENLAASTGFADRNDGGPRYHDKQDAVRHLLGRLSDRERGIIVSRFGLEGVREKSLREIGAELGISHERVRQIESKARDKLCRFGMKAGPIGPATLDAALGASPQAITVEEFYSPPMNPRVAV